MATRSSSLTRLALALPLVTCCSAAAVTALAAPAAPERDSNLFDLPLDDLIKVPVSTGVRFDGHTLKDTALSVVSFSSDEIRTAHGGSNDLNMVLRDLVPSFNYLTEPLNDGSSHVRAFSLRGLPADETLVLLNGKRFHRSPLVQVGISAPTMLGSQGADLSQLPAFGVKRIEVLRDGASAQYGSDAIAGVINLILPDRAEGGEVEVERGGSGRGNGAYTRTSVNAGTRLGDGGFLNVTGEWVGRDGESRGSQRPDAAYYASQGLPVANPAQVWGSPALDSRRLLWNARLDLPSGAHAYLFGNYSNAHSEASFNYRALTRNFFTNNLDSQSGAINPCPAVPGDQHGYQAARNCLALAAAGGLFNFQSLYPGGFTPRLAARHADFMQVAGISGDLPDGASFDVSLSLARSRLDFRLNDTINPSLGRASPTRFDLGSLTQTERALNLDFVWPMTSRLNLAAGAEWRQEAYTSRAGEAASWQTGPFTTMGIGANGMPGIDPSAAGRFARQNASAYADSEYRINDPLLVSAALRYERYSDFGNTLNGKLSLRYLVSDHLTLRGAMGTGFRAPSPGQSHLTNITHNAGNVGARVLVAGIIPPTSDIARFFGAQPLEPEISRNLSLGMAYQRQALSLSVDAFRIAVQDRIELSNPMSLTDDIRRRLLAAGIHNGDEYDNIVVFNNAADSTTRGIDLSGAYELEHAFGATEFKLNLSHVTTRVQPNGRGFVLSAQTLHNLAHQVPGQRASVTVRHRSGAWRFTASTAFYGASSWHNGAAVVARPSKSVTNAEAEYAPRGTHRWGFAAGVANLFAISPHRENNTAIGSSYITENPFEYHGRSFYVSAKYVF